MTSATRKWAGTVTMSGRGIMTSRTIVSPNSMIDSMRARSSSSMTPSSTPSSATASSSSSDDTNGPCLSPDPGSTRLETAMRPRVARRTGANRATARTGRATASDTRSGLSTAHVLGAVSASTNTTPTSMAIATTMPTTPKRRSARMPTRVACTSWQPSSRNTTVVT